MVAENSGTDARDTGSHENPAIVAAASNRPRRSRNALSIARGPTKFPKFPESCQLRITSLRWSTAATVTTVSDSSRARAVARIASLYRLPLS